MIKKKERERQGETEEEGKRESEGRRKEATSNNWSSRKETREVK